MARMDNTPCTKLFEYFYYPFKLNFLIGEKTWITRDPPVDRIYLSDGGHKDNYGLTSLILRRRCRKILICEGSTREIPLAELLQAFYWCDCFSEDNLKFFSYEVSNEDSVKVTTEGTWKPVNRELYEDYFRNHKKNEGKTYQERKDDKEKIREKRKKWSEEVLGGKKDLGSSPYCWMFKVEYCDKKFCDVDVPINVHSHPSDAKHAPDENLKEAFMWFVAPPIDGKLVVDDKLTPESQCDEHIVKCEDGNLDTRNLSGCFCDCCHMKCCSGKLLGLYPHFSTANQALTPSQNSALHVAGTLATKEALKLKLGSGTTETEGTLCSDTTETKEIHLNSKLF